MENYASSQREEKKKDHLVKEKSKGRSTILIVFRETLEKKMLSASLPSSYLPPHGLMDDDASLSPVTQGVSFILKT